MNSGSDLENILLAGRAPLSSPMQNSFSTGSETSSSSPSKTLAHTLDFDLGLVGRERERVVLEQAYSRVCCQVQEAPSEIVLIEGMSGMGKSSLASSLRESIDREDMGLFVRGKHDSRASTSYEAIVDAATGLCHAVLESEYYLEDVKEHLKTVLSNKDDRRLLVNLFPAARILVDVENSGESEQLSSPSNVYVLQVICKFWNAVASVHPVVLVLDDLQWADASARAFLTALVTDMSSTNLLVVGTFREGEFEWNFDKHSKGLRWRLSKIYLGALPQTTVNEIVSQATKRRPEETVDLTEAMYGKTNGNALFLFQFLDMLQSSGLLFFSFQTNQWEWKDDIAAQTDVSDTIAELLLQKLGRLSTPTQMVLMLASCLGHSFDRNVLERILLSSDDLRPHVTGISEGSRNRDLERRRFQTALNHAVKMGLLERVSKERLKFSHDAIQQAAFSIFPSGMDEDVFHSNLGERMLSLSRTDHGEDWMLFSAVDLMTSRPSTVEVSRFPPEQLAQLCLEASRKALAKSAFSAAAGYADRGYSLLSEPACWLIQYRLSVELLTLSSKMHHAYGNNDGAIKAASTVIAYARSASDKNSAQSVVIRIRVAQRNLQESIRLSVQMLRENGIQFPEKATKLRVVSQRLKIARLLRGRLPSDLVNLPLTSYPFVVQACRLLHEMSTPLFISGKKELSQLACLMMMRLTLTYGNSEYSPCVFAVYGLALSNLGRLDEAFEYGQLALKMQEELGSKATLVRTFLTVHWLLLHLREPIHASLGPLEHAYEIGMQVGDIISAGRCLIIRVILGFHGGMQLDHLEMQTREYCEFFRHYQLETALNSTLPMFQLVLNLLGKSKDPLVLTGEAIMDEAAFIDQQQKGGNKMSLVHLQNTRMILLVLLDELELADFERKKVPSEVGGFYHSKCCNLFFSGLACLGLAKRRKLAGQGLQGLRYQRRARKYRNRLSKFVHHGSINCIPFVKLLDAESSSLRSQKHSIEFYQDAIAAASRCGFRLCKGLAYEKAGQHLLERGEQMLATDYLQNAWNEYSDFGARLKLSQMEHKYDRTISFIKGDENIACSRPSSLNKPHSVRSILAASQK